MNRLEDAVRYLLINTQSIVTIVGNNVYHRKAKADVAMPYIVLTKVSTQRFRTLGASLALRKSRIQFDIYARPDVASDLRELIRDTLVAVAKNSIVKEILLVGFEDTEEEDLDEDFFSKDEEPRTLLDLFVLWEKDAA